MLSFRLVRRSIGLLSRRDQLVLGIVAVMQTLIAVLDLLAVLILGAVAAIAAGQGSSSGQPAAFDRFLSVESVPLAWLVVAAGVALIAKSLMSFTLTRRVYSFIANRQAMVSGRLAERLLTGSILNLQRRSSQETTHALTVGVNAATVNTLGPAMVIAAEMSLIALLTVALVLVDPLVALFALFFFGSLALILQLGLGRWARSLGDRARQSDIVGMESLQHSLRAYREIKVSGRRALFIQRFVDARWQSAQVLSGYFILSQFGKYVFEIGLVAGGGVLLLLLTQTRSLEAAVAVLTVFLLASSRVVPSLLRMQSAFYTIRNSAGLADRLFDFIQEMGQEPTEPAAKRELRLRAEDFSSLAKHGYPGFVADVRVDQVSLIYPQANEAALEQVSFTIPHGSSLALVGPSGSGKSSLADVILGVLEPTAGSVLVSGIPASEVPSTWPGAMAYVPQDVAILTGSIRSNVALGLPEEVIDDDLVWKALAGAHLGGFVEAAAQGLDTLVGENGVKLSGGQRQRLGLARALFSRPRLLVLDEATSALDAETEYQVTRALQEIEGDVTLVVVAHRLATVREANQVIYLEQGRVRAMGPFREVRQSVPEFERQAHLLGL